MRMQRSISDFSNAEIRTLFIQELNWELGRRDLNSFRKWVKERKFPDKKSEWPYSYFFWLVERIHEFGITRNKFAE